MGSEFYFAQIEWFYLLFPLFYWYLKYSKKQLVLPNLLNNIQINYPMVSILNAHSVADTKPSKNNVILLSIILFLFILSLTQPSFKTTEFINEPKPQETDLILLVNTSVSMSLRDYKNKGQQLNRMEFTKLLLKQLISKFKGQGIGLVILGRPASVWLPLTHDKAQVSQAVSRLQTTLGGRNNDISASLDLIQDKFIANPKKSYKTNILIIDDNYLQLGDQSAVQRIKKINTNGFTVHTLAIGSASKPDYSLGLGHLIYAPTDLKLMQSMADAGQGGMVHAWAQEPVNILLELLENKPHKQNQTIIVTQPLSVVPLAVALLLLLYLLFPISRSQDS